MQDVTKSFILDLKNSKKNIWNSLDPQMKEEASKFISKRKNENGDSIIIDDDFIKSMIDSNLDEAKFKGAFKQVKKKKAIITEDGELAEEGEVRQDTEEDSKQHEGLILAAKDL